LLFIILIVVILRHCRGISLSFRIPASAGTGPMRLPAGRQGIYIFSGFPPSPGPAFAEPRRWRGVARE